MRKVLLAVAVFGMIISMSNCENESEKKETNPYPDGVYPFEVSGVSHTFTYPDSYYRNIVIKWTTPGDSGFSRAHVELYHTSLPYSDGSRQEILVYSSLTGEEAWSDALGGWHNIKKIVLGKDSFSYNTTDDLDKFIIIKCADKFSNISEGVRYEFQ